MLFSTLWISRSLLPVSSCFLSSRGTTCNFQCRNLAVMLLRSASNFCQRVGHKSSLSCSQYLTLTSCFKIHLPTMSFRRREASKEPNREQQGSDLPSSPIVSQQKREGLSDPPSFSSQELSPDLQSDPILFFPAAAPENLHLQIIRPFLPISPSSSSISTRIAALRAFDWIFWVLLRGVLEELRVKGFARTVALKTGKDENWQSFKSVFERIPG